MAEDNKVDPQFTGLDPLGDVSPAFMRLLFFDGVLGTKEFRAWIAAKDDTFKDVRDPDVDNEIDRLARERSQLRQEEEARIAEEERQLSLPTPDTGEFD